MKSNAVRLSWTQFKACAAQRGLSMLYYIDNNHYFIFIADGPIIFETIIRIDSSRSSDQIDFEDNFKATIDSNKTVDKLSPMTKYIIHELDESGIVTYIGSMNIYGVWLVKKLTESGNALTITYANISNNDTRTTFALAWTNRLTLIYDLIENLTDV